MFSDFSENYYLSKKEHKWAAGSKSLSKSFLKVDHPTCRQTCSRKKKTEGLNDMLTITSRCFDLDGANLIGRTSHIGSLKGRRQLGERGEISSCCRDRMLVNQKLGTTGGRDANHIPNYLPKTLFWWQLVKHSVTQSNTILPSKAFHLICQFN